MKINTIILTTLIILFFYLLIINLIEYNTIIEGATVTLDSSDIESIYTNKQKLENIRTQQANIEAEITDISNKIKPIVPTYKVINKNMIAVTKKAEEEMKKQQKDTAPPKKKKK